MTELVKGIRKDIEDVLREDDVSVIIYSEPVLTRVKRKNVEQRKEYIKELVEIFKKEDWVKAIIICPVFDCTYENIIINVIPTYVDYIDKISDEELSELYNSTLEKVCNVAGSVLDKYSQEDKKDITIFLADKRLMCDTKSYIVYEKEHDGCGKG